jgi:hypothetical protein
LSHLGKILKEYDVPVIENERIEKLIAEKARAEPVRKVTPEDEEHFDDYLLKGIQKTDIADAEKVKKFVENTENVFRAIGLPEDFIHQRLDEHLGDLKAAYERDMKQREKHGY